MRTYILLLVVSILSLFVSACKEKNKENLSHSAEIRSSYYCDNSDSEMKNKIDRFQNALIDLKNELKLPGLSAAIIKDQKLVWESGMGYSDIEKKVAATPETPYQLASVTKPLASIVMLQLVEKGLIDLDMLISQFQPSLDTSARVKLLHLATHTSEGEQPGYHFNYNGNIYSNLQIPMKHVTGKSFRMLAQENVLDPLHMSSTITNPLDPEILDRFFDYLEQSGNESGIIYKSKSHYRKDFELYDDSSDRSKYGRSYWIASNLIAGALEENGINQGDYIHRPSKSISHKTQKEFNQFFKKSYPQRLEVLRKKARPYKINDSGHIESGSLSMYFGPGAGHISTVRDLAKLDIALDENQLITEESKSKAFAAYKTPNGVTTPYGIGWFVQESFGEKLVWHGGEWDCASALYFKIPAENLTLIVLSNSRKLSQAFNMGAGDVLYSGVALEFFKIFYLENKTNEKGPAINWKANPEKIAQQFAMIKNESMKELYLKQLHVMGGMLQHMGDTLTYKSLLKSLAKQGDFNLEADKEVREAEALVELNQISDHANESVKFSMNREESIRIYAIGEGFNGDMFDYGWITDSTDRIVWEMNYDNTVDAGGNHKNRKVDTIISLPKGEYFLHYKSDDSHSYLDWNTIPPDSWYWGIKVINT